MTPNKATYLFCLTRSDLLPPKLEAEGLEEGSPVLQHRRGDLAAVISEVSFEEFTGPDTEARLQDLAWLAPRALRHEQVIEQVAHLGPVFPARFGTIFTSLDSLEGMLDRHHDEIRDFLDRTLGKEEWGFKGFLDRGKAEDKLAEEELTARTAQLSASPGMRYMQERRLRAEASAHVSRWIGETSARIKEALSRYASEVVERKLLSAGSAQTPGEMVLNWAFLVPKDAGEAFRSAGNQLGREQGERGLAFEIAGPFPPYSFTPRLDEKQP